MIRIHNMFKIPNGDNNRHRIIKIESDVIFFFKHKPKSHLWCLIVKETNKYIELEENNCSSICDINNENLSGMDVVIYNPIIKRILFCDKNIHIYNYLTGELIYKNDLDGYFNTYSIGSYILIYYKRNNDNNTYGLLIFNKQLNFVREIKDVKYSNISANSNIAGHDRNIIILEPKKVLNNKYEHCIYDIDNDKILRENIHFF